MDRGLFLRAEVHPRAARRPAAVAEPRGLQPQTPELAKMGAGCGSEYGDSPGRSASFLLSL